MGRKTWDSLPPAYRPLKDRHNLVLSRQNLNLPTDVTLRQDFNTLMQDLPSLQKKHAIESTFIIGGEALYRLGIQHPSCQTLYLTHLQDTFDCDTFFPEIPDAFREANRSKNQTENSVSFWFSRWDRQEN